METTDTDKMLKSFFDEQKQKVEDNGFSKRTLRNLPEQTDRTWIVWVFALIGVIIATAIAINTGLIVQTLQLIQHVPVYYWLGGVFCFPLVGGIGFYFAQGRTYRLV